MYTLNNLERTVPVKKISAGTIRSSEVRTFGARGEKLPFVFGGIFSDEVSLIGVPR